MEPTAIIQISLELPRNFLNLYEDVICTGIVNQLWDLLNCCFEKAPNGAPLLPSLLAPYQQESYLNRDNVDGTQKIMQLFGSCVGSFAMAWILQLRDRHENNMLLGVDHLFYHIDFGFFLGDSVKPIDAPVAAFPIHLYECLVGNDESVKRAFLDAVWVAICQLRPYRSLFERRILRDMPFWGNSRPEKSLKTFRDALFGTEMDVKRALSNALNAFYSMPKQVVHRKKQGMTQIAWS